MAKRGRKPIPKTQKEISKSTQDPIIESNGNPNDYTNNTNRGNKLSFTDDTTKPFTLGLQDIDEAILYYFQNEIKPFVIQNGERLPVPVIYGNPERWKSVQKDGYYKDARGKIMLPLIMFKKGPITKIRNVNNKLDAANPNNIALSKQRYSSKNVYDNFGILNNIKPEITNHMVVVPDYVKVTYSCMISTYYIEQLNHVIEAIEYASDSYWGNPERYQFKTYIDTFTPTIEMSGNGERIARCNFDMRLNGYIIPDTYQKDIHSIKKYNIPSKINIQVNEQE